MEENNYFKVLGNRRIDIGDWIDPKRERTIDVDLEENNQLSLILKCMIQKETAKQMFNYVNNNRANEYYPQTSSKARSTNNSTISHASSESNS